MTAAQVVTYRVDDETTVDIEIDPLVGFSPARVGDVVGRVRDAAEPVIKAARVVVDQARQLSPDDVQVKFGLKANGKLNWLLARASTEGTFEVTLTWRPGNAGRPRDDG